MLVPPCAQAYAGWLVKEKGTQGYKGLQAQYGRDSLLRRQAAVDPVIEAVPLFVGGLWIGFRGHVLVQGGPESNARSLL
ncbi:MAG: hypothetical protein GY811_20500 [Myxococcales bacterium]|nr:hypothetical protein [Myxococcales bacterium]